MITKMLKKSLTTLLTLSLLLTSSLISAKNIQYVSDDLTIPMRSGITINHKILKFLNSGMAVEIIEETEDKQYALVTLVEEPSKTGWVETRLLMPQKSAREQLISSRKRNQSLKDKSSELKKELSGIKKQNTDLRTVQTRLENKIQTLQNTLTSLRENAAEPIRIADENVQLTQQLQNAQEKNQALLKENVFLGDQNIKHWFMIGAAVSIGSLILGLLITRISWKKKDRWA